MEVPGKTDAEKMANRKKIYKHYARIMFDFVAQKFPTKQTQEIVNETKWYKETKKLIPLPGGKDELDNMVASEIHHEKLIDDEWAKRLNSTYQKASQKNTASVAKQSSEKIQKILNANFFQKEPTLADNVIPLQTNAASGSTSATEGKKTA